MDSYEKKQKIYDLYQQKEKYQKDMMNEDDSRSTYSNSMMSLDEKKYENFFLINSLQ